MVIHALQAEMASRSHRGIRRFRPNAEKLDVAGGINLSTSTPTITLEGYSVYKTGGGELVIST